MKIGDIDKFNTKFKQLKSQYQKSRDKDAYIKNLEELIKNVDIEFTELKMKDLTLNYSLDTERLDEQPMDDYQLDLLEYIYINKTIAESKLSVYYNKDSHYRLAFTKLKDARYIYKRFKNIYGNSSDYYMMKERELEIAEILTKAKRM